MKITTILGSPRKRGNTAKVLGLFEELVAGDHAVDRIDVASSEVNGCLGCDACQKVTDAPGCVQKDEAVPIFGRMLAADVIVYATPLYCWGFSAQMKALLDRHYCLVTGYLTPEYNSLLRGKRVALLVTCAEGIEDNADLIQVVFDRLNDYSKSDVVGKYIVPFCTTPDSMGPEGMETARRMVSDIMGG